MSALSSDNEMMYDAVRTAGLDKAFAERSVIYDDCPACRQSKSLRLDLGSERVQCSFCGMNGPLLVYLRERVESVEVEEELIEEAETIPLLTPVVARTEVEVEVIEPVLHEPVPEPAPPKPKKPRDPEAAGRLGERIIMTVLAGIFLLAGLAAAALSGFANYQAFSDSVGDPLQGQIWGWSGVIASVCSFGGFTFFWWHASAKRWREGGRALVFAMAGAATSLAGTAMFMGNNQSAQQAEAERAVQSRAVVEAQIEDWTVQLGGIPPETRSVKGLEDYIAGVEQVGLTHQKPYRDAQNELGLAKRRADLESKISNARAELLGQGDVLSAEAATVKQALPSWFFALMLEVFSSQGTSIAFVCLLLLYGVRGKVSPQTRPGSDSSNLADPEPA